jgi:hypothetical protein
LTSSETKVNTLIQITRSLARQLRAVFRQSIPLGANRNNSLWANLQAGPDGLEVIFQCDSVAVIYRQAIPCAPHACRFPLDALKDIESRRDDLVQLEATDGGQVRAQWSDDGIPQTRMYAVAKGTESAPLPPMPAQFVVIGPGFLKALDDARQTVAKEAIRYALNRIQLRGETGDIIATDGKQLLKQSGFQFPWKEDVLVPALAVFGGKELVHDDTVTIGKTPGHLVIRSGPWTFFLGIDTTSRYPKADLVIPSSAIDATTCRLSPEDAAFLGRAITRLPGARDEHSQVTLDLNGDVAVRGKAADQPQVMEIMLARSSVSGRPVRVCGYRSALARAVAMGFMEICVAKPDVPVVCRAGQRTYVFMPLDEKHAIPPSPDAIQITGEDRVYPKPMPEKRVIPMPTPEEPCSNHPQEAIAPTEANDKTPAAVGSMRALVTEAESLRSAAHDLHSRSTRLIVALRQYGKRSRLMASTLASLRQLQKIAE